MAATHIRFVFTDGRTEDVKVNSRALIEAERKFKGNLQEHPMEGQCYAAWWRLGSPGSFTDWMDSVEDWDIVDDEEPAAAPFQPAPSGDS
jgi:hypothetical protein